jgi:cytochrome c biogenesis protein CcmG, thiol:disulfide interchange protein DsbE
MRERWCRRAVFLASCMLLTACAGEPRAATAAADGGPATARTPRFPEVGSFVPAFRLEPITAGGGRARAVTLAEHSGKPMVLVFWSQWCPPCRDEYREMQELARDAEHEGFALYGVIFQDMPTAVLSFQREHGDDVPMLLDPGMRVARAYLVSGVPRSFAIGADGRLRMASHAYRPGDIRRLVDAAKSPAQVADE